MSKVQDLERLASQLALYDTAAAERIIKGLPEEKRTLTKRLTNQMKNPQTRLNYEQGSYQVRSKYVRHTTHIPIKKLVLPIGLSLILLYMSGYMV